MAPRKADEPSPHRDGLGDGSLGLGANQPAARLGESDLAFAGDLPALQKPPGGAFEFVGSSYHDNSPKSTPTSGDSNRTRLGGCLAVQK